VASGFPLLERESELTRIAELVAGAKAGEFGAVVVEGPAGAGKSAILGALAAHAEERGLRVLRAVGLELEREYPFGVVRQLFEPAVFGLAPAARDEVFVGAAALADPLLTGGQSESAPQPAGPGFGLLHSLYWVLVGLADLGPVALLVDDVQWADSLSLRFLAFALRRAEELPVLLALGRRDTPTEDEPDELVAVLGGSLSVIRPRPLSGAAIGVLLAGAVGRGLEEGLVAEAERLTAGNPLYVRELADALTAARFATVDDPLGVLRSVAPAAIGHRVQVTLRGIDPAARELARAAAILGDDVPLRCGATLADLDERRASVAADAAARAGILLTGEPLRFPPSAGARGSARVDRASCTRARARTCRAAAAQRRPPSRACRHASARERPGGRFDGG